LFGNNEITHYHNIKLEGKMCTSGPLPDSEQQLNDTFAKHQNKELMSQQTFA